MTPLIRSGRRDRSMFGLTEEQITDLGMTWGLTFLIGYMLFII